MDLVTWIASDLRAIRSRFERGIVSLVEPSMWKVSAGSTEQPSSSIAFLLLHMSYHHDLAIQTAVQNHAPLMTQRRSGLGLDGFAPHAGLEEREDRALTSALDLEALNDYAATVWDATADWLGRVATMAFDTIPDAGGRIEHLAGVTKNAVPWLHAMWTGQTVGWFAQWEAIGHGYIHLGEMTAVRNQLGLSPF